MLRDFIPVIAVIALTTGAQAKCQPTKIETDINAIRLGDEKSTEKVLGNLSALPMGANGPDSDLDVTLYNGDKTEQALLYIHPGGSRGSFDVMEVKKTYNAKLIGKTVDVPHFMTERGIHLGVSPTFVTSLLGDCYSKSVSKDGAMTIEYWIEDINMRHPFLKRVNIPTYYGRYHFRDGKLEAFEIGSEEP